MKFLVCKVNSSKDIEKIGRIADQFGINLRGIVGFFDDRIEWCAAMAEFGTLINSTMTDKIVPTPNGVVKLEVYKNNFSFGRFHFNCEFQDESEVVAQNYKNDLTYGKGFAQRYVDTLMDESEVEAIPIAETPIRFLDSLLIVKPTIYGNKKFPYSADGYTDAFEPLSIDTTGTLIPNRLVVTDDLWYVVSEDQMFGFCILPFFQGEPIFIKDNIKISPMCNNMREDRYIINYHITLDTYDAIKFVHYVVYFDENDNVLRVLFDYVTDIPVDPDFPFSEIYRDIIPPKEESYLYQQNIKSIVGC